MRSVVRLACVGTLLSTTVLSGAAQARVEALKEVPVPVTAVSTLDMVTVMATKSPLSTFSLPGMATVVNGDQPGVAGSSTLEEALKDVPGLTFGGSARRNGQDITLRGYDSDATIILFDGVRQRFESAHDGKFFIDPLLLKQVEVIRGPNSALYGSGGLGGVIAFETKDAADLLAPGENFGATTTLGAQSVNDEWLASQAAYGRIENVDVLAQLLTRNSGNIELGGNAGRLPADDEVLNGLFKMGFSPAENHTLRLSLQGYNNQAEEPNNPQAGIGAATATDLVDKDTSSYTTSLGYEYSDPTNDLLNLTTKIYFTDTEVEEDILVATGNNAVGDNVSRNQTSLGFNLQNQSRFGTGTDFGNIFTYGFETYREELDSTDSANGTAIGIPTAEADFWGAFLQDEISIQTSAGEVLIIPGARFDSYESNNDTGASQDESRLSPKLGATYKPVDWMMLFGNYAQAFRAPDFGEVYATGNHFTIPFLGTNTFIPNPSLKPEKNTSVELGLGFDFDDVLADKDEVQIKASTFRISSRDFINQAVIGFVPFGPGASPGNTISQNVPHASLHGHEIEGGYENERIRLKLGYSVISGKDDTTGAYLDSITPRELKTNFAVKLPEADSVVGLRSSFVDNHDKVSAAPNARDGFSAHDVYYQWEPEQFDNIAINLGVDNIFDKEYDRVFAGSPEPGRNYKVQVSVKW